MFMAYLRNYLNIQKRTAKLVLARIERAGFQGECGECYYCAGDLGELEIGYVVECPKWTKLKVKILDRYSYSRYKGKGGVSV